MSEKKTETERLEELDEQKRRADQDPALRAELAKKAATSETTVSVDGTRAHDAHFDKDGVVLAEENREASYGEQLAALAPDLLDQVIRMVPWARSGSIDTSDADKADNEVTIKIVVSREDPVLRRRREAQGKK